MKVTLRLFAVARELASASEIEVDLPEDATVADLRTSLLARIPALDSMASQLRFAVNESYANDATSLKPNDDVACIPPVSGG